MAKKNRTRTEPEVTDIDAWIDAQPAKSQGKLRGLLDEVKQLVQRPEREDLRWWHRLGARTLKFFPKGDRQYGASLVELMADYIQPGREQQDKKITNLLYRARQLAAAFTMQEVVALEKKRHAAGQPLKLHHVTSILAVEDKDERDNLLEKCLEGEWSVARLRQEIQNRKGRKRVGGGQSPKPPTKPSPGVALRDITVLAKRWMACHGVWFVGSRAALKGIPVKVRDEAMLEEIQQATDNLLEVAEAVKQGLAQLKTLQGEVERTIKARS